MLSSLLFLLAATAATATTPTSQLTVSTCDAGEHYQFEIATCSMELRNSGDKTIRVSEAGSRFTRDSVSPASIVLPPKGVAYVEAKVDLRNKEGLSYHSFRFVTDEPGAPQRGSGVSAYVQSVLDQSLPKFDFGIVKESEAAAPSSRAVTLSSREVRNLRITSIETAPEWLDVRIDGDGRTVRAALKKNAPWGVTHNGAAYVKLGLNAPQQPHAWIEVDVDLRGDVVPDSNPFQLGMMRSVGKHEFLLRLTNPSGKKFKVGKLVMKGIEGKASAQSCTPAASGCRLIHIVVDNHQPLGRLPGSLEIELPEFSRILPVELFGILISPETKIHELNEQPVNPGAQSSVVQPVQPNLKSALENAVRSEAPPPLGSGPLLRWGVAHQTRIYGYVIYRSESEDGPLLRVNREIIPLFKDGTDASGSYQWRDDSTQPGKSYWYQIGILNRDGSKEDLTGRQKIIAK